VNGVNTRRRDNSRERLYPATAVTLRVEYAERRIECGILIIFSLLYEYSNLEYVHIHAIHRVNQAEYRIRIRVATPREYVNILPRRWEHLHARALQIRLEPGQPHDPHTVFGVFFLHVGL